MTDPRTTIDAQQAALLVLDYQPGILGSLAGADSLVERAAAAIDTVRRHGGQIGYVRVAFTAADLAAVPATSGMAATITARGAALHADSPASATDTRVAPLAGDIVVRKTRVGAFSTTDLDQQLRDRGVGTLIIAGISTSGVVLSTIRDAYDRDYRVFVLIDACADPQPGVHEFLTTRIFPRQAGVLSVADLPALLTAAVHR